MIVGLAALLSCAHAMWMAAHPVGVDSPDVAHTYALALEAMRAWGLLDARWFAENVGTVVPNPQLVPIWMGLWMALFGGARIVAVGALLPFHVLAAAGLWRGGNVLGGRAGGAWALLAGLGAAGTLTFGSELLLDFPLMACTAYAAGQGLAGRWNRAAIGLAGAALCKLAALPVLAVLAIDALVSGRRRVWVGTLVVAALYVPNVGALVAYAGDSGGQGAVSTIGQRIAYHLQSTGTVAGPALLAGVVLALLARGDVLTLRVLAWAAGALLGLVPLAFFAQVRYALPVVPLLAIASAGAATAAWGRWGLGALGLLALVQVGGYHTARDGWPGRPVALRAVETGAPFDVDAVFDWLLAHAPPSGADRGAPRTRVALHLAGSDRLHYGLFAVRALERGLPLELVVIDDHRPLAQPTDLGVVIAPSGVPTVRQGWRSGLPPATATLAWPDGYVVELWDRGLPPETLLATPEEAERRNHPSRQGLWVYVDGEERGPLIAGASSAEVVRTEAGWEALFVRDQAIWRASSTDGFTFGEARPLVDATGPIVAFDPAVVEVDGELRLFAAELVGSDRRVDPASHATRIVSWRGPSLDALVREAGVRIEGMGMVDPSVRPAIPGGPWRMYLTEGRSRIMMATSPDGITFERDPRVSLEGYTVPQAMTVPQNLLAQRQVMGWSVLVRASASANSPGGSPRLLELCGTGPALVEDRLYYTRSVDPCPVPVALPDRRETLDQVLAEDSIIDLLRTEGH
ncbi:MAG: hypothetical protein V4850_21205 [Myxococcota bacterium]